MGGKLFTMFPNECKEPAPGTKPKSQDFNGRNLAKIRIRPAGVRYRR